MSDDDYKDPFIADDEDKKIDEELIEEVVDDVADDEDDEDADLLWDADEEA